MKNPVTTTVTLTRRPTRLRHSRWRRPRWCAILAASTALQEKYRRGSKMYFPPLVTKCVKKMPRLRYEQYVAMYNTVGKFFLEKCYQPSSATRDYDYAKALLSSNSLENWATHETLIILEITWYRSQSGKKFLGILAWRPLQMTQKSEKITTRSKENIHLRISHRRLKNLPAGEPFGRRQAL